MFEVIFVNYVTYANWVGNKSYLFNHLYWTKLTWAAIKC